MEVNSGKKQTRDMEITYIGGSQAGIIGLLTILGAGHRVVSAMSYDKLLTKILSHFEIPIYPYYALVILELLDYLNVEMCMTGNTC